MEIRLQGEAGECQQAAEYLLNTPGIRVLSVSKPYRNHGASLLVRVFLDVRLDAVAGAERAGGTPAGAPGDQQSAPQQVSGRRHRALPPGDRHE